MAKHITSRTWLPDDLQRLEEMVTSGMSEARAAVAFKRTVVSVKIKAKANGFPFPDERELKRKRRSNETAAGSSLYWRSSVPID